MKTAAITATTVAFFAANVVAFPAGAMDALTAPLAANAAKRGLSSLHSAEKRQAGTPSQGTGALPLILPPFDAKSQYVSNQGQYAFVAPGPGDARGECPGLNAMANHNYLPHNGVATITQFISATQKVFGMSEDLGGFLSVYGAVIDGTLTGWSINGGPHIGIGGSHNNYEADSSPLKGDLNQYGDNGRLIMSQFYELYNMQPNAATANYNLEVMRAFRATRFQESISKNPDFSYLPFPGILVSQAAFTFIYRFMSNKSAQYPEGILNKNVLKSFHSIYGTEDNLTWVRGHERIPDNWYKRNDADQYSIPYFMLDVLYFAETVPRILEIGCNHGAVNTYNTIDPAILSNGAYTASQLAKSPICFVAEFTKAELPGLTGLSSATLAPLTNILTSLTANMSCAAIGSVNTSALSVCPGFSVYGGPTGPVAPGAIQS